MKREKIDLSPERSLITNLIVSTEFCREVVPVLRPRSLKASYAVEVATWVSEYWQHYKTAPLKDIQSIYLAKKSSFRDEDTALNVAEFLTSLSDEHKSKKIYNVDFEVKQALAYLKTRSLEILRDDITETLAVGDVARGEQLIANYKRVEQPLGEGVDIIKDSVAVASAFLEEDEFLFQFPGAAGGIIGRLNRGDFLAFLAPMKRGKTWWLIAVADLAAHYGFKVLFVTLEMTKRQMIRRTWQALVGQPRESGDISWSVFEKAGEQFRVVTKLESREKLSTEDIKDKQKVFRKRMRSGGLRILSFPAYSATVETIESHIDNMMYYDNYSPDVVVVDYADIVAPSDRADYRHQLDGIWKRLRKMAHERNILVATASQAEKSTFHEDVSQTSVSEDIRKLAHVTCMVSLNQTESEAEAGLMRIGQVAIREGRKNFNQAVVTQCLEIGRPLLDSRWRDEVIWDEPDKKEKKSRERSR